MLYDRNVWKFGSLGVWDLQFGSFESLEVLSLRVWKPPEEL